MQEASFTGFFRAIIFMVGFYYVFRFLARIFMPILMNKAINKVQENFQNQQSQYHSSNERNTDFVNSQKTNPTPTKQVGDYIDYEEVE